MASSFFDTIISSTLLVGISEVGDKTQLLSFSLAAKYKKPWPILSGILFATIANHTLAAWAGQKVSGLFAASTVSWILGVIFIGCALWALVPDKIDDLKDSSNSSIFLSTTLLFFLAEMGDKTQLATAGLGARYQNVLWVTLGTTAGMMITDGVAVFLGDRLASHVRGAWIRWTAAALFLTFGVLSIIDAIKNS